MWTHLFGKKEKEKERTIDLERKYAANVKEQLHKQEHLENTTSHLHPDNRDAFESSTCSKPKTELQFQTTIPITYNKSFVQETSCLYVSPSYLTDGHKHVDPPF